MQGGGSFHLEALDPAQAAANEGPVNERLAEASTPGFLVRLWAALVRRLLGKGQSESHRGAKARSEPAAVRLTFRMSLTPSGTMGPMLDAMIKPVMVATAEDLAERIVAHLENR